MENTSLMKLLENFTGQDLADALFYAGLPQSGSKEEKIRRLCSVQGPPLELLGLFRAEAIRDVCRLVGIQGGRKDEMIRWLIQWKAGVCANASSVKPEGFTDSAPTVAPSQPTYLPPTKENVIKQLSTLTVPRRKAQAESNAQDEIGFHLGEVFEDVVPQYNIGGYLGLKIDIDVGNGKVGVEVKLADSLIGSASEIHRLIGQAVYYQKKRYQATLIIAIVGRSEDLDHPVLKETCSFLEEFNITCVRIPIS